MSFFGTWDLHYVIFLRMLFFQKFRVFRNIFRFPAVHGAPKWN